MDWLKEHGSKVLALLSAMLAGSNGLDPTEITALLGEPGKRWAAFLLASATLAHATFVAPQAAAKAVARRTLPHARPVDPPPTKG